MIGVTDEYSGKQCEKETMRCNDMMLVIIIDSDLNHRITPLDFFYSLDILRVCMKED